MRKNPDKFRLQFWLSLSGARKEKELHKDYYYKINYQYPEYIPSKCESVIAADLKRTFPNDDYFKKPENKKKLTNVLMAYSRRNSKIGYCQGFNLIAAKLLKLFDKEEDVFWIFVQFSCAPLLKEDSCAAFFFLFFSQSEIPLCSFVLKDSSILC